MQGKPQRAKASKPLPHVDPQLIAACKARDPGFGQGAAQETAEGASVSAPPSAPAGAAAPGSPNIVFILTDDLSMNLLQFMPHVLQMQKDGVTFNNYFVTDSLCCPSRSSIFTGRYPHNTGVFKNVGVDGGYLVFRDRGNDKSTFATALTAAGYRTAFYGKYLNGYEPEQGHPIPPGWHNWVVAGNGYGEFHYAFNQNGQLVRHGNKPEDYLTDVVSDLAVQFIKAQNGTPFMIEVATFAPHAPYTPAPRDADAFPGLHAPRTPAYNAPHDAVAPHWLAQHPALTQADMDSIDADFRKRAQSVQAVDKMIGELQAAVAAVGQEKNTYFVFSSDNGYHMGEYRLMPGKMTAYDTDIHVPLIVTGPGISAGRAVDQIAENIDLCPTFTDLAGAAAPPNVDGLSLVPLLHGQSVNAWRSAALVEHHGPVREPADPDLPGVRSGNPATYEAIRTEDALYVEYADGEKEYHALRTDPDELRNTFSSVPGNLKKALHETVAAAASCRGAEACRGAGGSVAVAPAAAPPAAPAAAPALRYIPASTVKLQQLIGDYDKQRRRPTLSQTVKRYGIQGTDLGYSFDHNGLVYFLFGDTVGRLDRALDTIASTDATDPEAGVRLDFLTVRGGDYLTIQPPGISMGAFETPVTGISLNGRIYVAVCTNHAADWTTDRSVLTRFTPPSTFEPLRTISQLPAGHFFKMSVHAEPAPIPGLPPGGPFVLVWGSGTYRKSDEYFSIVPAAEFESGKGTRYFAGLDAAGAPRWSEREADAQRLVENGTMGDVSVTWAKDLGLWLMVWDSRPPATRGILFSYAGLPWGPWSAPQVIFDPVRDGALGKFIHNPNAQPDDGLAGPVIGKGQANPGAVHGGNYAPYVVERWTKMNGAELNLYYVLSTWNPYVVVLMKSRFETGAAQ